MFIGTKQEKIALMKNVIPLFLTDEDWLVNVRSQYEDKEYNNIREAIAEAIELKYIENAEAVRTVREGIHFQYGKNGQMPILTKKGERFLKPKI